MTLLNGNIQYLQEAMLTQLFQYIMQRRMLHLEPVAIYTQSPDYLSFAYKMMKEAQLVQAQFRSLQKRLTAVAAKIKTQNVAAKSAEWRMEEDDLPLPSISKTASLVGVKGGKRSLEKPGEKTGSGSSPDAAALRITRKQLQQQLAALTRKGKLEHP
jgi:hypothetical protein